MTRIELTREDIALSKDLAKSLGSLNNSILSGAGNRAGILGELALCRYLGIRYDNKGYKYDLLYNGKKLEVKTKRRTVSPRPEYEVSIAQTSEHQKPDLFVFLSITFKKKVKNQYLSPVAVWLCGAYDAKKYFLDARFIKAGTQDGNNNFISHADMYNMKISDLDDFC